MNCVQVERIADGLGFNTYASGLALAADGTTYLSETNASRVLGFAAQDAVFWAHATAHVHHAFRRHRGMATRRARAAARDAGDRLFEPWIALTVRAFHSRFSKRIGRGRIR